MRSEVDLLGMLGVNIERLHRLYERATADLAADQWHALVGPRANHIAFTVWHWVRTEDDIVRLILQGRPSVWVEGGWAARLDMPAHAQGTGMTIEEAQALRVHDPVGFRQYMRDVFTATQELLASADEGTLARVVIVKQIGEMTGAQALTRACLTHGFTHLGEIELTRVLLGLPTAIGA